MRPGIQLGRRTLRDGCHGPDVAELQRLLSALGYQPGPVDGAYGLLTEEAVLSLQRDFGLRVDGVAGPAVSSVLSQGLAATLRVIHVVQPSETVYGLSEKYRVSARFFREHQRIRREADLFPGRQLVIPVRSVYAWVTGDEEAEGLRASLARHFEQLTALVVPWYRITSTGAIEGKLRQDLWEWSKSRLFPLLPRIEARADGGTTVRRARQRAAQEIAQAARRFGHPGVVLTASGESPPEPFDVWALAREIKAVLPRGTRLMVDQPLESGVGPLAGGVRPSELARVVDRLVVGAEAAGLPAAGGVLAPDVQTCGNVEGLRRTLKRLTAEVPCWKVLLRLDSTNPSTLSQLTFTNRFNLAGTALTRLGRERELVWRGIADSFSPAAVMPRGGSAGHIQGTGA